MPQRTATIDVRALQEGPRRPATGTPPLVPGSLRRTSHVDVGPADGAAWGGRGVPLDIRGVVRDARADGPALTVLDETTLRARVDGDRAIERLELDGHEAPHLAGVPAAAGFRGAALEHVEDPGSAIGVVLRDLPTAVIILAGYASMRTLEQRGHEPGKLTPPRVLPMMADHCSGWRAGGVMTSSIARGDGVPFQTCPPAPDLGAGWHELPALPEGWMRRRRRVDLIPEGTTFRVDAMFRDSHESPSGTEEVLHEWALQATFDEDLVLRAIAATPHVLPFTECPWAADNVEALVGTSSDDLRVAVADRLGGPAGCTHLNDLLQALGDLPSLLP